MDGREAGDDVWTGDSIANKETGRAAKSSGDSNAKVTPMSYMEQLVLGIGMSTSDCEKDIACEHVWTKGWTSPRLVKRWDDGCVGK